MDVAIHVWRLDFEVCDNRSGYRRIGDGWQSCLVFLCWDICKRCTTLVHFSSTITSDPFDS